MSSGYDLSNPSLQNAPGIEQHRFTPNITPISSANERPKPGNGNWTNVIPVVDVETDTNTSSSEDECSIPGAFCKLGFDRSSSSIIFSERLVDRSSNYSGERIN
jgi:hypothetical protein